MTPSCSSSIPPVSDIAPSLTVRRLSAIDPLPPERKWLIDSLWLRAGVGILGGSPKLGKTFLAIDLAIAVTAGTKALGRFQARAAGPVLVFCAEHSLSALRVRCDGLLADTGIAVADIPLFFVDTPALRLDRESDLNRLRAAIEQHRPLLLVLDPFVRIAAIDENSAAEVSCVLASLRTIQRDYDLAVLVVHHARKSPAAHPTQALRGSSDFAAWSDTNLCLTRHGKNLVLFIEHRDAQTPEPVTLTLATKPAPHLVVVDSDAPAASNLSPVDDVLQAQVLEQLRSVAQPVSTTVLRERIGRRKTDVIRALEHLRHIGAVERTSHGWAFKSNPDAR